MPRNRAPTFFKVEIRRSTRLLHVLPRRHSRSEARASRLRAAVRQIDNLNFLRG